MKTSFREGTSDSLIFEGIFKYDEYKLPSTFSARDIIIDIGAHIGLFTCAVLQRGARKIYAFEPDEENYRIATDNLKEYIEEGSVLLTKGAIWRSDIDQSELTYAGYIEDTSLLNTGSGDVIWHGEGIAVPAVPLDDVILHVTEEGQQRIRLLKMDCEGSEWPALFTSKTLHLIDEISGEFHELGGRYDGFTPPFSIGGLDRYTIHLLRDFLEESGFKVTYCRTVKADGKPTHLGMFFATRAAPGSLISSTRTPLLKAGQQWPQARKPVQWLAWAEGHSSTGQPAQAQIRHWVFKGRVFAGYTGWIHGATFSPDSSKVLSGTYEGQVHLWEASSGQLLKTLEGHTGAVECVAFSPDGTKALTGSYDGTARLWETASGRLLAILEGHTCEIVSIAFSADGTHILTGSSDRTARLWETASARLLAVLKGHAGVVVNVAFSPDGERMLTGSHGETVRLWEISSGRLLTTLKGHLDIVESAVFSPDGSKLVIGSANRTARLWETASGCLLVVLKSHHEWVVSLAFSPDGSKVLTGSYDGTARLWETASGKLLGLFAGHSGSVESVTFSSDGGAVLTGASDRTARLWETASGRLLAVLKDHHGWVVNVAFSQDESAILTGTHEGEVRLWDREGGCLRAVLKH